MKTLQTVLALLLIMDVAGCSTKPSTESPGTISQAHEHDRNAERQSASVEPSPRDQWQKPEEVIQTLNIRPGERIADVGCGPGYFTMRLADSVGPKGTVWAVDINQEILNRLQEQLDQTNLKNVKLVLAPPDDPLLPQGQIDTILIVNTYHHFSDRSAYNKKLRQALAPGGRMVIIDFVPKEREERGFGPPKAMQLSRETVDAEMAEQGLHPTKVHDFLPEQYFVEYR